eukprot:360591-Chlamydomonas_euryale.AAC.8
MDLPCPYLPSRTDGQGRSVDRSTGYVRAGPASRQIWSGLIHTQPNLQRPPQLHLLAITCHFCSQQE